MAHKRGSGSSMSRSTGKDTDSYSDADSEATEISAEVADQLCSQFQECTSADSALALCYLQNCNWDMNKAVNIYFQSGGTAFIDDPSTLLEDSDKELSEPGVRSAAKQEVNVKKQDAKRPSKQSGRTEASSSSSENYESRIRLLSWNIDGLDQKCMSQRVAGLIEHIKTVKAHIVFLQEVVPASLQQLEYSLGDRYEVISQSDLEDVDRNELDYFVAILIDRQRMRVVNRRVVHFARTCMQRCVLHVAVEIPFRESGSSGVLNLHLLTAHLESTKQAEFAKIRCEQLAFIFRQLFDASSSSTTPNQHQLNMPIDQNAAVLFGGDLNLREAEANACQLPARTVDLWHATGARPECRYTWDASRNSNIEFGDESASTDDGARPSSSRAATNRFRARLRFDRLFYRPNRLQANGGTPAILKPVYFELSGIEKLRCGRFVSDHWAIFVHFDLVVSHSAAEAYRQLLEGHSQSTPQSRKRKAGQAASNRENASADISKWLVPKQKASGFQKRTKAAEDDSDDDD